MSDTFPLFRIALIFVLVCAVFIMFAVMSENASNERRHTTETAQQAISHFMEDVHGGQLESDLWAFDRVARGFANSRYTAVPDEIIWLELLVWLTLHDYDITHNQIRREFEEGRISIERYVNISGLREVLNE